MNKGVWIMALVCNHPCNRLVTGSTCGQTGVGVLPRQPVTVPFGPAAEQAIAYVVTRLEHAGRTVLALPGSGYTTGMKTGALDFVRTAVESYGYTRISIRPAAPTRRAITDMDESYAWLSLIPDSDVLSRRVVGARSLVSPITDRHLYSWRKLGNALRMDYKAVQGRHDQGIAQIVTELHRTGFFI